MAGMASMNERIVGYGNWKKENHKFSLIVKEPPVRLEMFMGLLLVVVAVVIAMAAAVA